MKGPLRALQIGVALTALSLSPLSSPALAAPVPVQEDTTENEFSFSYDEETGTVTSQSSLRRAGNGGVRFEVSVTEADGYGAGLVGKLRLRLEGKRAYLYDGWFALKVTAESGDVAYTRARPATVHLKPQPGQRRASLTFKFDLPSGSYEASGAFERN